MSCNPDSYAYLRTGFDVKRQRQARTVHVHTSEPSHEAMSKSRLMNKHCNGPGESEITLPSPCSFTMTV
jgi:hypothetical protein